MDEEKTKLREALFTFYFEEGEDRIPITSLLKQLNPIVEVWQNLRTLLEKNVTMYDWSSGLDLVKIISYQGNTYLFIKENMWSYIIININSKKVLTKEEVTFIFSKEFFVQNLEEEPTLNEDWLDWCYQCRNANKIVEYCLSYEDILKLPNSIVCEYKIKDAITYLRIGLSDKSIQLGFQTPDQFLYEFLNLNFDLTPWGMQDAYHRLGIEKMKEMLAKVKEAKIPLSFVPQEFLEENTITRKLERKEE